MNWSLPHAKRKLRALVREAQVRPQIIVEQGKAKAVMLSVEYYQTLTQQDSLGNQLQERSLIELLQSSPHREIDLNIERSQDTGRDVTLE